METQKGISMEKHHSIEEEATTIQTTRLSDRILNFVSAYFTSSFIVIAFSSILKLIGLSRASWWWITSLMWIPPALLAGSFLIVSLLFYVGFLVGFIKTILEQSYKTLIGDIRQCYDSNK